MQPRGSRTPIQTGDLLTPKSHKILVINNTGTGRVNGLVLLGQIILK